MKIEDSIENLQVLNGMVRVNLKVLRRAIFWEYFNNKWLFWIYEEFYETFLRKPEKKIYIKNRKK